MRRRKGISSIYGFVMIFLLTMASLQVWSSAVSSMSSIEGASGQSHQLEQMQSIEHLSLAISGTDLTISNNGEIPSTLEYLRLVGTNDSRTIPLDMSLAVGSVVNESIGTGSAIEVVTSLGNVFALWPSADPPGAIWSGTVLPSGAENAQIFQSPYDPSSFFLADGPTVHAFSSSSDSAEWSFDAGIGLVTDVLPLADGDTYVSVGYGFISNIAELFELDPTGNVINTYDVRLLQTSPGTSGDSVPVFKGADSSYALYDGWFYSENGSATPLESDYPLAGNGAFAFYFYKVEPAPDSKGTCQGLGNEFVLESYTPAQAYPGGLTMNWDDYVHLGACNPYPQQIIGSAVGGNVIASLLASPPYAETTVNQYSGQNPSLVVISSLGHTDYVGETPESGYTAVATNGTVVFLALPEEQEIQVFSISTGHYETYGIGIPASQLLFEDSYLFAISSGVVNVFSPSMTLEKTIELSPLTLASAMDSFPQEAALQTPSFLVLNSTSYAALLVNATGFTSLVLGRYA